MAKRSAGLLLWRRAPAGIEVLLGHPGGPLFAARDEGCWSVPKGEYPPDEPPLEAAYREFAEELGVAPPDGDPVSLGDVVLRSGKVVTVYAQEGDLDPAEARSNLFAMEWPPRSGRLQQFPELDRVGWFPLPAAREKLAERQRPFLDRLADLVGDVTLAGLKAGPVAADTSPGDRDRRHRLAPVREPVPAGLGRRANLDSPRTLPTTPDADPYPGQPPSERS